MKLEIIRTLGRIDTDKAKYALLDILKDYWQRGPNIKDKKAFRLDRDFAVVMPLLLKTLYKWGGEEDVFKTIENLALSEDVKNLYTYPNGIGQGIWEVYLKGKLTREDFTEEKDSAVYLLDFIESEAESFRPETLGAVKLYAAHTIFEKQIGEGTLALLLRETKEELSRQILLPEPEIASERSIIVKRLHQLSDRRDYLSRLLRKKAQQTSNE